MSRDAPREDLRAWTPTREDGSSRSGDSFLKEVLQVEPSSRLPVPGQWLGGPEGRRFELLEPMGRGRMGQVFRARDATLGREVARPAGRPGRAGACSWAHSPGERSASQTTPRFSTSISPGDSGESLVTPEWNAPYGLFRQALRWRSASDTSSSTRSTSRAYAAPVSPYSASNSRRLSTGR
jgi:hypothetical protein